MGYVSVPPPFYLHVPSLTVGSLASSCSSPVASSPSTDLQSPSGVPLASASGASTFVAVLSMAVPSMAVPSMAIALMVSVVLIRLACPLLSYFLSRTLTSMTGLMGLWSSDSLEFQY